MNRVTSLKLLQYRSGLCVCGRLLGHRVVNGRIKGLSGALDGPNTVVFHDLEKLLGHHFNTLDQRVRIAVDVGECPLDRGWAQINGVERQSAFDYFGSSYIYVDSNRNNANNESLI